MAPLISVTEPLSTATTPRQSAWLIAALALAVASVWLAATLRRWWERRARVRRAARAQAAERDAPGVLSEHGFRVVGRQVRQSWGVIADGDPLRFTLIADYLVEREGQRWVAEVKTGPRALDLRHGPTRRQLLEYRAAFSADGVLLVDTEGRRLQDVRFSEAPPAGPDLALERRARSRLVLGVAVGLGIGVPLGVLVAEAGRTPSVAAPARVDASTKPLPALAPPARSLPGERE